jgi:fucose permease
MSMLLILAIYLAFFSMGLPDGMIGAAWPSMYRTFEVPIAYAGGVTMLVSTGTVLSALCTNALISRWGAWRITVGSTLLTALALLGFAVAPSYGWLCGCALPLGLGAGAIDAVLNNYVALHGTSRQMSWVHVAWGIGATGGPCLLAWILAGGGVWQGGYWSVAALQGIMTLLLLLSRPLWHPDAAQDTATNPVTTREALKLKGLAWALLGLFAMQGLEFCTGIWSGTYLHLVGDCSAEMAARWAALFYGGMTCGRFFAGFIADRLGDRQMLRLGACGVAIGVTLLITATTTLQLQIGLGFIGLGVAPLFPCFLHATPTNFGPRNAQAVMGLQMACAYTGATLMPPLLGWVAQFTQMTIYPYFLAAFLLTMTLSLERLYRLRR